MQEVFVFPPHPANSYTDWGLMVGNLIPFEEHEPQMLRPSLTVVWSGAVKHNQNGWWTFFDHLTPFIDCFSSSENTAFTDMYLPPAVCPHNSFIWCKILMFNKTYLYSHFIHSLSLGDSHHHWLWRQNSSDVDRQGHCLLFQCLRHLLLRFACCKYNFNQDALISWNKCRLYSRFLSYCVNFSPNFTTTYSKQILSQFRIIIDLM